MRLYIKLTKPDGTHIFVNADKISYIEHCEEGSIVNFQDGSDCKIFTEDPDTIMAMLGAEVVENQQ